MSQRTLSVPVLAFLAIWERTRLGRTAAVRRRDAGSVLVTLVRAGSDADGRPAALYTLRVVQCPFGGRTRPHFPPTSGQFAAI